MHTHTHVHILYKPEKLFGLDGGLYLIFRHDRNAARVKIMCPSYWRVIPLSNNHLKILEKTTDITERYFLLKRIL